MDIGSRRELFVDRRLVDRLEGDICLHLHRPAGREVVLVGDEPWEDHHLAYIAVMHDDDLYRMYYRPFHHGSGPEARGEAMCYAESTDGIHWVKPRLGLFSFQGSAENNIVLGGDGRKLPATGKWRGYLGLETGLGWRGDMVPFRDANPDAPPDAAYRALIRGCRGTCQIDEGRSDYGMYPFASPDGLHWSLMSDRPVITRGKFDSQNLAFWDAHRGRYVAFVRDMRWGTADRPLWNAPAPEQFEQWRASLPPRERDAEPTALRAHGAVRDIRMCTSEDFLNWTEPEFLAYEQDPGDIDHDLYTNAIVPYDRAPHILLGFPTEIVGLFSREGAETNPLFMASRDGGRSFRLWPEPIIPREAPRERDGNRSNYMARGLVRGNEREYFVYADEGYSHEGGLRRLRRFVYRVDGFVSARAGLGGGELVTPPLVFSGSRLVVNYIAWPHRGSVRVELQDPSGRPLDGLALADATVLRGDEIEQTVTWQSGASPGLYSGRAVRLRFALRHADLFSFQFTAPQGAPVRSAQ